MNRAKPRFAVSGRASALAAEIPAVERRVGRQQSALVFGQGPAEGFHADPFPVYRLKGGVVIVEFPQLPKYRAHRGIAHFVRGEQRGPDLVYQVFLASVEEQGGAIGDVVECRGIALDGAPLDADGRCELILREPLFRDMAVGAGQRAVEGKAPVEEEAPSEFDAGGRLRFARRPVAAAPAVARPPAPANGRIPRLARRCGGSP